MTQRRGRVWWIAGAALLALSWGCGNEDDERGGESGAMSASEAGSLVDRSGPAADRSNRPASNDVSVTERSATGGLGELGGPCYWTGACNDGLECVEERCRVAAPATTAESSSGEPIEPPCTPGAAAPEGFVRIEPGSFTMGSPEGERGRSGEEGQVEVTLTRAFYLQTTPVTQGQYLDLMGSNPSRFDDCGLDCPVESVTWHDALAYVNALSAAEGLPACYDGEGGVVDGATIYDCRGYRLPTEAEWEYAARAGTTTATYNGDMPETGCEESLQVLGPIAWYKCNSDERTHPVAQKEPNACGLYDMLGNVTEWTDTWYIAENMGGVDPVGIGGENPPFWPPRNNALLVRRGGSFNYLAPSLRVASRGRHYPEGHESIVAPSDPDFAAEFGFRVARTH